MHARGMAFDNEQIAASLWALKRAAIKPDFHMTNVRHPAKAVDYRPPAARERR
jgi:hypothetical protein